MSSRRVCDFRQKWNGQTNGESLSKLNEFVLIDGQPEITASTWTPFSERAFRAFFRQYINRNSVFKHHKRELRNRVVLRSILSRISLRLPLGKVLKIHLHFHSRTRYILKSRFGSESNSLSTNQSRITFRRNAFNNDDSPSATTSRAEANKNRSQSSFPLRIEEHPAV